MKNPLTWLFGFTDTPNPDLIGRVMLKQSDIDAEVDAEAQERFRKKHRRARAYIRMRKLNVQPAYISKPQTEQA